jgi:hypothetical protein
MGFEEEKLVGRQRAAAILLIVLAGIVTMGFAEPAALGEGLRENNGANVFPGPEELASLFVSWLARFGRPYGSGSGSDSAHEKLHRFAVFIDNFRHVFHHNVAHADARGYWLGLNAFSDLTHDEFKAAYLWKPSSSTLQGQILGRIDKGSFLGGHFDIVLVESGVLGHMPKRDLNS